MLQLLDSQMDTIKLTSKWFFYSRICLIIVSYLMRSQQCLRRSSISPNGSLFCAQSTPMSSHRDVPACLRCSMCSIQRTFQRQLHYTLFVLACVCFTCSLVVAYIVSSVVSLVLGLGPVFVCWLGFCRCLAVVFMFPVLVGDFSLMFFVACFAQNKCRQLQRYQPHLHRANITV